MNPATAIALFAMMQSIIKTYFDLTGKTSITKDDLAIKSPEEILKEMGIELTVDQPVKT